MPRPFLQWSKRPVVEHQDIDLGQLLQGATETAVAVGDSTGQSRLDVANIINSDGGALLIYRRAVVIFWRRLRGGRIE